MKLKTLLLLILALNILSKSYGQYKAKDKLQVKIDFQMRLVDSVYSYRYEIMNSLESKQSLNNFTIETGDENKFLGGTLTNFSNFQKINWSPSIIEIKAMPLNPKANSIISWVASYGDISSLEAIYSAPESALRPGESAVFTFESEGLPSIMRFWAQGWIEPYLEEELDSLIAIGYSSEELSPPWYENAYEGKTVAPVLPDLNLAPAILLETIKNYLAASCTELGWISNQGICRSLEAKLENAERQLNRGNTAAASGSLQAFINEVEALKGKQLSSEAYALLYFNGRYLLERIDQ